MQVLTALETQPYLIQDAAIIDVRAPVEFRQGAIPGSVNLPILDDQERAIVGTCYKQHGREAALTLGHRIVSGENKKFKIDRWTDFLEKNPSALLTCFRGGLRSQIAQTFLKEAGINIQRIQGGYKEIRQFYLEQLKNFCAEENQIKIITGETGSGKTQLLNQSILKSKSLDIENIAAHRGSAFGRLKSPQPSQTTFENSLSHRLLQIKHHFPSQIIFIEDESRVIGSLHLPENLFLKMRTAPVIRLTEPLDNRVKNIFEEYITADSEIYFGFENAVRKISKKLGSARSNEIIKDIQLAKMQFLNHNQSELNKVWIEKILVWYYDPLYQDSLKLRNPYFEFSGSTKEIKNYLDSLIRN